MIDICSFTTKEGSVMVGAPSFLLLLKISLTTLLLISFVLTLVISFMERKKYLTELSAGLGLLLVSCILTIGISHNYHSYFLIYIQQLINTFSAIFISKCCLYQLKKKIPLWLLLCLLIDVGLITLCFLNMVNYNYGLIAYLGFLFIIDFYTAISILINKGETIFSKYTIGIIFILFGLINIFNYVFIGYRNYQLYALFFTTLIIIYLLHYSFVLFYKYKTYLLYEKERCFDDSFDNSSIGMALVNLEGKIIRANKALCDMLGFSIEELKNMKFPDYTYPEDLEKDLYYTEQLLSGKICSFEMEKRYIHKEGRIIWAILNASIIKDKKGKPLYFSAHTQNITSYKCLQNELIKSNEEIAEKELKYRSLVEQSLDGIMVIDGDGHVIEFNEKMESITWLKKEEVLNKTLWDVYKELCPAHLKNEENYEHIKNYSENKFVLNNIPYDEKFNKIVIERRDGSTVIIEEFCYPIVTESASMTCFICRDITELVKLEEIKEKAMEREKLLKETIEIDRLRTEFFANLSHEFRTPLNIILSSNKLLHDAAKRGEIPKEYALKYLDSSKRNCYRLLRLINNIIDSTKIDAGFFHLDFRCWDIVDIVEEITQSIVDYSEVKGITIVFDTDVEEKLMLCDVDSIERIILNLLSNAIKFTDYGGSVMVNVSDKDDFVEILVKDSGIGIAEEQLTLIFERFKQVDKSLTRRQEGSGIGLSLVKSLVEMHGGTIEVSSTLGEGTCFFIRLPVKNYTCCEEIAAANKVYGSKVEKVHIEFSDIYF